MGLGLAARVIKWSKPTFIITKIIEYQQEQYHQHSRITSRFKVHHVHRVIKIGRQAHQPMAVFAPVNNFTSNIVKYFNLAPLDMTSSNVKS
jgi:hypothetical protein